jgi:hypothetical protein
MRELRCTKSHARHQVHQKIADDDKRTGDPIWRPIDNRGYTQLRRAIIIGRVFDDDLV